MLSSFVTQCQVLSILSCTCHLEVRFLPFIYALPMSCLQIDELSTTATQEIRLRTAAESAANDALQLYREQAEAFRLFESQRSSAAQDGLRVNEQLDDRGTALLQVSGQPPVGTPTRPHQPPLPGSPDSAIEEVKRLRALGFQFQHEAHIRGEIAQLQEQRAAELAAQLATAESENSFLLKRIDEQKGPAHYFAKT